VLALAVPVTQLRSAVVVRDPCCCPDPAYCQCPDHGKDAPAAPTMQACGKSGHIIVAPTLPAFALPPGAPIVAIVPARSLVPAIAAPHAPPDPDRPAAPS
jgi:hypothetical protein